MYEFAAASENGSIVFGSPYWIYELNKEMTKLITLKKLFLKNPYVWLRLLSRSKQYKWIYFLMSTLNIIPAYLAEIEYYGVYDPKIEDATLMFIIFKPLEYLAEAVADRFATKSK